MGAYSPRRFVAAGAGTTARATVGFASAVLVAAEEHAARSGAIGRRRSRRRQARGICRGARRVGQGAGECAVWCGGAGDVGTTKQPFQESAYDPQSESIANNEV